MGPSFAKITQSESTLMGPTGSESRDDNTTSVYFSIPGKGWNMDMLYVISSANPGTIWSFALWGAMLCVLSHASADASLLKQSIIPLTVGTRTKSVKCSLKYELIEDSSITSEGLICSFSKASRAEAYQKLRRSSKNCGILSMPR